MVKETLAQTYCRMNLCAFEVIFNAQQIVRLIHIYVPCKFVLFLIMKAGGMILEVS